MAERVVRVTLSAQVAEYKKGMQEAAQATRTAGTEAEKLTQQRQAFELMGRTMFAAGGVMAAGLGLAVAKFSQFDEAMSHVQASTHESAENMDLLRDAALEAGASTVFSATESANAIEELAKAGLSTSDILGGALTGSLDLAAAGGLGVAQAAGIAATTLQQFRLSGNQASHVADLLAAGAGKAMGDVTDLSGALNQTGLVANQFGLSVEETVGTLSAFASAGMLGSDAGTSMRTMLLRLANPTGEVKELMAELGIEAYDAQGKFIGLAGLAGELETSLEGMTDAQRDQTLAMVFGQDAIRGANILLREGKAGIQEWTRAVDDQGYAAETAAMRLDNMKGDLEALGGAFDTAMIGMGAAADGPGRFFIQMLTEMVDGFNELPAGAQQATFWVGAVGAAAAIAGGAYLLAVPKIVEYRAAVELLGPTAQRASRALGALARAGAIGATLGIAVYGIESLADMIAKELLPSAEQIDNKMRSAKSGVDLFAAALNSEGIKNTKQAGELLGNLGKQLDAVAKSEWWNPASISGTAVTVSKSLAQMARDDLPKAQAQFRKLAEDANLTDEQMSTFIMTNSELQDALTAAATAAGLGSEAQDLLSVAMGDASSSTSTQTSALEELQGVAVDTESDVNALADAIRNFGSAAFDTERAAIDFHGAFLDLDEALADGAGSLDVVTEAGQNTRSAMLDVAQSTNDYAASVAAMGGSTEEVQGILDAGRQKIIDTRIALGDTEEAARQYADQLIATPETIASQVSLNGVAEAQGAIDRFVTANNGKQIRLRVTADGLSSIQMPNGMTGLSSADGNLVDYKAFADGGFASGIYAAQARGIHKFAEPETIWEAYISGKPDARDRNIGIWQEAGRRLGVDSQPAQASFPDRITLVDESGSILTHARVIADASATSATTSFATTFRGGRRR